MGSVPGLGRSPGGGHGNPPPLQYSCLGNPIDRGAWRASVHRGCEESDITEVTEHAQHASWEKTLAYCVSVLFLCPAGHAPRRGALSRRPAPHSRATVCSQAFRP